MLWRSPEQITRARAVILTTVVEGRVKIEHEPRPQFHKRLTWISADNGVTKRECHVLDVSSGGGR